jgi:hypothetical protein
MVRHEAKARLNPQGEGRAAACCACPTGESPVPVGVGAPGSRPQVVEGDLHARAGRQKPVRRRKPRSGEQARGPQHEVKPAASTDLQPAGRAAHVTAKATPLAREPKRAGGCGGVWGAARVQGQVRNVRGPSARPESGQASSYKPKAKSNRAQRESEGIVVLDGQAQAEPTKAVRHNAAGGKGPCGGHAEIAGKREGMAGKTEPNDPGGDEPNDKVRQLQRQLWAAAKRAPVGREHVKDQPCGRDDPQVACRAVHNPAQSLFAGAGLHNAASRQTTGKPCAGNPHARFERGCWLCYRPSGLNRANIYQ